MPKESGSDSLFKRHLCVVPEYLFSVEVTRPQGFSPITGVQVIKSNWSRRPDVARMELCIGGVPSRPSQCRTPDFISLPPVTSLSRDSQLEHFCKHHTLMKSEGPREPSASVGSDQDRRSPGPNGTSTACSRRASRGTISSARSCVEARTT